MHWALRHWFAEERLGLLVLVRPLREEVAALIFKEPDALPLTQAEQGTGSLAEEEREEPRMEAHAPFSTRPRAEVALGDEVELLRLFAQTRDSALKEELVRRLTPLARSLALRYRGSSEQIDDLMQVAFLGLLKALDGFDPERGKPFAAYAAPTILGELRRHFRDHVGALRLPRGLQERAMAVQEAARQLSEELGRSPSPVQIAERLELSEEDVWEALQADDARRTHSLDFPTAREDPESVALVETLGQADSGYEAVETQLAAEGAQLHEHEHLVLQMYFDEGLTQHQIGDRLGVSQMQVSRIVRGALRKLLDAVRKEA